MLKKIKEIVLGGKNKEREKQEELFFTRDWFINGPHEIGAYTYGKPNVLFENEEAILKIGKFCSLAKGITIFLGGNHRVDWVTTYPFNSLTNYFSEFSNIKGHPATNGDVTIGNDVWIGRNATIMSGVSIGNGAVVASESVVAKNIGPYEIWGGNPARLIRKRFDDTTIKKLLELQWWNWDLDKIKENIPVLCSDDIETLLK